MKFLITGCNGQLGNELKRILLNKNSEIGQIPKDLIESDVVSVDVDELDITDLNNTIDFINKNDFNVIINCAAYTNVDACEKDLDNAFKVNSIGPRNLAIAAENNGAKFIHVSTDYVFSGDGNKPYVEWEKCSPKSIYGKSKYLGEQYVRNFCSRYFIVRTAWLYGYNGNNFVKTIIKLAKERGELKVVNDQIGNPTNANDLAYHLLMLSLTQEYGVYHCTGNGECSWFDFASKIVEFSNINAKISPCTTEEFPRPAKRPSYSSLDNMMLRLTIGDHMRTWEDALKCYIENLKDF